MAATAQAHGTNAKVERAFRERTPGSAALYERACKVLPAGLTHDSRTLSPYGVYAAHAAGPRKTDVDGNSYVDYFGGHGALMLGHSHPKVVAAIQAQAEGGTHYGSSHEREVEWAEFVARVVPAAERVRFTASGTEASHLALRLARAYSGKPAVIRFVGHFHGWHDAVAAGSNSHFDGSVPAGINPAIVENTILLPTDDPARVAQELETRDDIGTVMIEPSGASWGLVPLPEGYLESLREITSRHGATLIFDEVVTGFRWSLGGAQAKFGITPDLCVFAKVLAGGMPGGAVAGRADILDQLDPRAAREAGHEKIPHQGTFNANPVCAAAAVAALREIEATDACTTADAAASKIRDGLRSVVVEAGIPWGVYGDSSTFLIFTNAKGLPIDPATFDPRSLGFEDLKAGRDPAKLQKLRLALLANGVDIMGAPGGVVSAMHGEREIADTVDAFRTAVRWLKEDGEI